MAFFQCGTSCILRTEIACTDVNLRSLICDSRDPCNQAMAFPGDPETVYAVPIRVRGVIEAWGYVGGTNDGAWFQIGGAPQSPNPDGFNIFRLKTGSDVYYLNRAHAGSTYVKSVDYTATINIRGGACVTLMATDVNQGSIRNCSNHPQPQQDVADCTPYVIAGIPPAPDSYNGQFLQIDFDCSVVLPPP